MRFTPEAIEVRQNEIVRFVVRNSGKQMHEMVLGTMTELKQHHALMQKLPGMEHEARPGEFHYGCLIPGHFEAGMIGRINVRAT